MLNEQQHIHRETLNNHIWQMKGQAVPLFGYHMLRDYVLPTITGDHQGAVLYWVGKDLAQSFKPTNANELIELFLETGWGHLEMENDQKHSKTFILESPFFPARKIEENQASFALECGFLAECIALMEQSDTQGEFLLKGKKSQSSYVEFTIHIDKEK